jgi:GNAT superfamily N-acetyltransferase
MEIGRFEGDRETLRALFRLADDSEPAIDGYLHAGEVLVAIEAGETMGHLQLVGGAEAGVEELKSMAVVEPRRGAGVGRALVEEAVRRCRARGTRRLLVSTAAADVGNLRFYQRLGFRMLGVERDAFVPATGYPDEILIDGIVLRDRVWLDQVL